MYSKRCIFVFCIIFCITCLTYHWWTHRNIFIDDESHRQYLKGYKTLYDTKDQHRTKSVRRVLKYSKDKTAMVPLLSEKECGLLIFEAESYAKENGWTRKRHENYPTTDLPVSELEQGHPLVMSRVYNRVIPKIETLFEFEKETIEVHDLFLIRYTEGGQNSLQKHQDGSLFSFIVPLNDQYEGGGTEFKGTVIKSNIGEAFLFCGQHFHSGLSVTKGTRYVLAGFLYVLEE